LLRLIASHGKREALVWRNDKWSFDDLRERAKACLEQLASAGIEHGSVVALEGDYSPSGIAAFLALIELRAIVVPLTRSVETKKPEFYATSEIEWAVKVSEDDALAASATGTTASHDLYGRLRAARHPGLVLFSSGSTGRSKGVVHDLELLVQKYLKPRHCYRTLAFLLFDHIGGLDTLFYNLANGSCLVTVADHSPDTVCAAIARHRVEVLPVSPTFLNLMLLTGAHRRHDMRSLQIITYGAEVMPESTLRRVAQEFPSVRLVQKFGATEVGTLRSQSQASGSPWVRIGGEGYQVRIVDGLLEIRADSAMLGYLNAPSPFTEDGWFMTGDAVEVDGDYMRILGRRSEMINVGGEKVFPAEIEDVLLEMPGIQDVSVIGEPNPITGHMVVARVNLSVPEEPAAFRRRMREFCRERLASFKIPARVVFVTGDQHSARHKKMRLSQGP
jgi:acyl-CoA synthetase (AMP-forming)/AMP-acid ligase II